MDYVADLPKPQVKTEQCLEYEAPGVSKKAVENLKGELRAQGIFLEVNDWEGCYISWDAWEDPEHEGREGREKGFWVPKLLIFSTSC